MKTFTARDLSRSAAGVLAASDVDGVAKIRTRDGRAYELRPVEKAKGADGCSLSNEIDRHCQRIGDLKKKYGVRAITQAQWKKIDRLVEAL